MKEMEQISEDDLLLEKYWKALDEHEKSKLKRQLSSIDGQKASSYEIFFKKYSNHKLSCFEKLCSTKDVSASMYKIFFRNLKKDKQFDKIKTKYMNAKNDIDGLKLVERAFVAENFILALDLLDIIELSNDEVLKAIIMIDAMKFSKESIKHLTIVKNDTVRRILKGRNMTKNEWNDLYKHSFDDENTKNVLFEFLMNIELDLSIKESFLNESTKKSQELKLFECVLNDDTELFLKEIEKSDYKNKKFSTSIFIGENTFTLLQLSCSKGLKNIVKILLETKCDINEKGNNENPLTLAFLNCHKDIIELLMKKKVKYNSGILLNMLKMLVDQKKVNIFNTNDYKDCLKILQEDESVCVKTHCSIVFSKYVKGKTHDSSLIFLLSNGASVNIFKDGHIQSEIIFENIHKKIFDKHFNESITIKNRKYKTGDTSLMFDYSVLKPTIVPSRNELIENCTKKNKENFLPEIEPLLFLSKFLLLNPLMKHPLIQSFVQLKWKKMKPIFYTNIIFFLSYLIFLLLRFFEFINFFYVFIVLLLLIVREVFQIYRNPLFYFTYTRNWPSYILIFETIGLIFINFSVVWKEHLWLITVATASSAFVAHLTLLPSVAELYISLEIKAIKFGKFLIFLVITIVTIPLYKNLDIRKETVPETENGNRSSFMSILGYLGNLILGIFQNPISVFPVFSSLFENESNDRAILLILIIIIIVALSFAWIIHDFNANCEELNRDAKVISIFKCVESMSYIERIIFGIENNNDNDDSKIKDKKNLFTTIKEFLEIIYQVVVLKENYFRIKIDKPDYLYYLAERYSIFKDISSPSAIHLLSNNRNVTEIIVPLHNMKTYRPSKALQNINIFEIDKDILDLALKKTEEHYDKNYLTRRWINLENKLSCIEKKLEKLTSVQNII